MADDAYRATERTLRAELAESREANASLRAEIGALNAERMEWVKACPVGVQCGVVGDLAYYHDALRNCRQITGAELAARADQIARLESELATLATKIAELKAKP